MDLQQLQEHVDKRFDKLEEKLDTYGTTTTKHETDLVWIKGAVSLLGAVLIAVAGFLAAAYFGTLGR